VYFLKYLEAKGKGLNPDEIRRLPAYQRDVGDGGANLQSETYAKINYSLSHWWASKYFNCPMG